MTIEFFFKYFVIVLVDCFKSLKSGKFFLSTGVGIVTIKIFASLKIFSLYEKIAFVFFKVFESISRVSSIFKIRSLTLFFLYQIHKL